MFQTVQLLIYVLRINLVDKTIYEYIYIYNSNLVVKWRRQRRQILFNILFSCVLWDISPPRFLKTFILFIITVYFVYIYGLSDNSDYGKEYMSTFFKSNSFNSSPLSLLVYDFIAAQIFLIRA